MLISILGLCLLHLSADENGGGTTLQPVPFEKHKSFGRETDYHLTEGVHKYEEVIFVHIPKTAGMSFRFTINNGGRFGAEHTEKCYVELYKAYKERKPNKEPFTITFFRAPRAHVYSQFLECKHDNWGKRVTRGSKFPRNHEDPDDFADWVDHFYDSWNKEDDPEKRKIELDCFHCYHPYNMQSRAMSNECDVLHYLAPSQSPRDMVHGAKENMHALSFVGITELYDASLCLFWIKTDQDDNIEEFCNPKRDKETQVTHHVPKHSLDDIPKKVWKRVDALTSFDALLYNHAVYRFLKEFIFLTEGRDIKVCDFAAHKEGLLITIGDYKYSAWIKEQLKDCDM